MRVLSRDVFRHQMMKKIINILMGSRIGMVTAFLPVILAWLIDWRGFWHGFATCLYVWWCKEEWGRIYQCNSTELNKEEG